MESINTTADKCTASCPISFDSQKKAREDKSVGLFDEEWEVFVIKRNAETNKYDWFTLCCEDAA